MIRCTHKEWHKLTIEWHNDLPPEDHVKNSSPDECPCQKAATHFFVCDWNDTFMLDARCEEHLQTYLQETREVSIEEYVIYQVMIA